MATANARDSDALWRFSVAFYTEPGVAEALTALQDQEGLDVNQLLFALWFGLSGRGRLDRDVLAAADRAVASIRTEVVEPLRALRRRLKTHPDEDVQRLREGVKELELTGEKLVQTRLVRLAGIVEAEVPPLERRLADAHANFELYVGPGKARASAAGVVLEAIDVFAHGPPFPAPHAGEG